MKSTVTGAYDSLLQGDFDERQAHARRIGRLLRERGLTIDVFSTPYGVLVVRISKMLEQKAITTFTGGVELVQAYFEGLSDLALAFKIED